MEQRTQIFTDTQCNITKQLEKKLKFLWHVDGYIMDADRNGDKDAANVLCQIKIDEERHARMLKELLLRFSQR
jgi:hypothetical protein